MNLVEEKIRSLATETVKELIIRLKNDDHEAYRSLYELYSKKLFSFSYSYFKSRELSEESVHDVFVKIWENRHNLNENLSFNSYIFTITKNQIIDTLRRFSYEQLAKKVFKENLKNVHSSSENQIIYKDLENLATEAIEKLPLKRKAIFNLSRQSHMSYQEIADHLGISIKTVEAQMTKALKFLREYLYKHGDLGALVCVLASCFGF